MQDLKLSNQARTNKKQGRIYSQKSTRYNYNQGRNEIHHRIQRLLKKQNCNANSIYYEPNTELSLFLKQDYQGQVQRMIRYWGGGEEWRTMQFRKLGRMDKIRMKMEMEEGQGQEEGAIEIRNKSAFLKRVLGRLDNKYRKWILAFGLLHIQSCKKPSRQIYVHPPFPITSR